jgi:glutathione S-transferase
MSLRLITIPLSHYCDKARWALERSDQHYTEDAHLQGFHYLATLRRGAGLYVPVLIHGGGTIRGSAAIARWADAQRPSETRSLYPAPQREEIEAFEERLDEGFGVPGRLFMYQETLQDAGKLVPYLLVGVPGYQKRLAPHVIGAAGMFIKRRLGVTAASAATARSSCMRVLDEVARMLEGRRFLFGDTFTAADLTFAALAAPLTLPREYGVPLPQVDELNHGYAEVVREVRQHPAGAFALRMYAELR